MTEIERRLYKYYRITRYGGTTTRQRAREDIIDPWNAAEKAMKEATLTCPYCSGEIGGMQPRQMPHGGCNHCAPLYAALAKMEGHSHSRDEAMVEDKRYEKDDIYKK